MAPETCSPERGGKQAVKPSCCNEPHWPCAQAQKPPKSRSFGGSSCPRGASNSKAKMRSGVLGLGVLFSETVDATGRVEQLLPARKERMARSADIKAVVASGRVGLMDGSACTGDGCGGVLRMSTGLHVKSPWRRRRRDLTQGPEFRNNKSMAGQDLSTDNTLRCRSTGTRTCLQPTKQATSAPHVDHPAQTSCPF